MHYTTKALLKRKVWFFVKLDYIKHQDKLILDFYFLLLYKVKSLSLYAIILFIAFYLRLLQVKLCRPSVCILVHAVTLVWGTYTISLLFHCWENVVFASRHVKTAKERSVTSIFYKVFIMLFYAAGWYRFWRLFYSSDGLCIFLRCIIRIYCQRTCCLLKARPLPTIRLRMLMIWMLLLLQLRGVGVLGMLFINKLNFKMMLLRHMLLLLLLAVTTCDPRER